MRRATCWLFLTLMLVALLFGGAQPVDALPAAGSLDAAPAGGLLAPSHVRFRSASNLTVAETTVALQQGLNGYTGGHDTTIYQYDPDNAENYRWQSQLKVGYKQQYASILRFDLSSIPPNATITQATLQLFAEGWSGSAVSLGTYLITRSTTVHQATWNSAQTGYPWATPGANHVPSDRLSSPHSSVTVSSIGGWSSLDLTQAVQDWISTNRPNNGILLRATLGTSSVHFSSAQCPAIGNRPRLVVTYQSGTSPEPELSSSPTPTSTRTKTPTATPTATQIVPAESTTSSIVLQTGQDGYTGGHDTTIYQYNPDNAESYRWLPQLKVGYKQQYASILRFDLSSIPADATITRATLQLFAEGWSGSAVSLGTYLITRSTTVHQATWNSAKTGYPWASPGANHVPSDRLSSPHSSVTVSSIGGWSSLDLTQAVQDWISTNRPNNGILLRATLGTSSVHFSSAQCPAIGNRPRLVVTYQSGTSPEPELSSSPTPTSTRTKTPTPTATSSSTPISDPGDDATSTPTATPTATQIVPAESTTSSIVLQTGQDGYTGGHDTTIYQYDPDNAESYRWLPQLKVGYKQQYASILRFDLSSIPPNATITQATLQLFAEGWSGSAVSLGTYLITRSTTVHQATWNSAKTGYPWASPGANHVPSDRLSSPESSVTVSTIGGWSSLDLTQAIQDWISTNRPNNGILLRATLGTSSVHFSSAQCPAIGNRPRLVVTYQSGTSPEPELSSSPTPTSTRTKTPTPTQGDQGLSLVIGHLTDAHIGGNWVYEQRLPTTLQVVSKRVQVIVDTGDCTEDGTASQSSLYVDIMRSNATVPWRAVPGNHDTPHEFSKAMGPLQWAWDVGGYRLIGINTEDIDYAALDNALTHEKPCIVFGHFPLSWCDPTDQYKLRLRFRAYSVPIYIAGHTHLDLLEVDRDTGTLLLTGQRAGYGHYRIVTLRNAEVISVSFENVWD